MAIEGIHISLSEVTQTASTIKTYNDKLATRLDDIKTQMNGLATTWQSDASNTIREKFNALTPRFEEYKSVVNAYALFLENTVKSYETTEATINSNASSFK